MPKVSKPQVPDESEFRLPFPPTITAHQIMSERKVGKKATKAPNAFMIYRKIFSKEMKDRRFQQKNISSLCSNSWKSEPDEVKKFYHKLAHEADKIFLQDSRNDSQLPRPPPPQQQFSSQSEIDKHLKCFDDIEKIESLQETQSYDNRVNFVPIQLVVPNTHDPLDMNQGYIQQPYYYSLYEPTNLIFFEENQYFQ
jgi:hypothetical protein